MSAFPGFTFQCLAGAPDDFIESWVEQAAIKEQETLLSRLSDKIYGLMEREPLFKLHERERRKLKWYYNVGVERTEKVLESINRVNRKQGN